MRMTFRNAVRILFCCLISAWTSQASDNLLIDLGSTTSFTDSSNRTWSADTFLQGTAVKASVSAVFNGTSAAPSRVYSSAVVSSASMSFNLAVNSSGRHWLRLHFAAFPTATFSAPSTFIFDVTAGGRLLLANFSIVGTSSITNGGDGTYGGVLQEFSLPVNSTSLLVQLVPAPSSSASISGIELISMPEEVYNVAIYNIIDDGRMIHFDANLALATQYRIRCANTGALDPSQDVLSRTWQEEFPYQYGIGGWPSFQISDAILNFNAAPYYIPNQVGQNDRELGDSNTLDGNLSYLFPVATSANYLLRLVFCENEYAQAGYRLLDIFINEAAVLTAQDIFADGFRKATARDFFVPVLSTSPGELKVEIGNSINSLNKNPMISGIEVLRVSTTDLAGNTPLAPPPPPPVGPNPVTSSPPPPNSLPAGKKSSSSTGVIVGGVVGGLAALLLLALLACFFLMKKRKEQQTGKGPVGKQSKSGEEWAPLPLQSSHSVDMTRLSRGVSQGASNVTSQMNSPGRSHLSRFAANGGLSPLNAASPHSQRSPGLSASSDHTISFEELWVATKGFHDSQVLGSGGFGKVYRGVMRDGTRVAVKRASPEASQGLAEFETEVKLLSRLRHRHLVSLIAFCEENDEMILVYEYMANGPLRAHLYGTGMPSLTWKQRLEACIGAARGLHYLHTGAQVGIIHRDVKSTNILLDDKFVAKMADFGLSKLGPSMDDTHVSTVVKGSFGYLDPEYFRRQQLTEKSDVYSLGVVLLEVLCARPAINPSLPRDQANLVDWALRYIQAGAVEYVMDPQLKGQCSPASVQKYVQLAIRCLDEDSTKRPAMGTVLFDLEHVLQLQMERMAAVSAPKAESRDGVRQPPDSELDNSGRTSTSSEAFSQLLRPGV